MLTPYHLLPDNAKVWIFQANRSLTQDEVWEISDILENFTDRWQSHGRDIAAFGSLYYRRFVVLMADESAFTLSGCSIDIATKLMKELESAYDLQFFDRMKLCYKVTNDLVGSFSLSQLAENIATGKIKKDTIVFNNLVDTKLDFETKWEQALQLTPYAKFLD
ncbi:MAG TPA: hypothetical protein PKK18_06365 [Chitinophagales bacterium]|nr:hypothetical protein [Chitinophagales bacterium]HMW12508.1 hypothetical protein [Chitinophagales bacterium]HMX60077.1 hypothetical protein [Chitinophagales bacterium]HMY23073.1 hypothetical protein [Chitinophagales bacterium]HMZ33675.1 hypothetical protein [Chitinophagales bacterium]